MNNTTRTEAFPALHEVDMGAKRYRVYRRENTNADTVHTLDFSSNSLGEAANALSDRRAPGMKRVERGATARFTFLLHDVDTDTIMSGKQIADQRLADLVAVLPQKPYEHIDGGYDFRMGALGTINIDAANDRNQEWASVYRLSTVAETPGFRDVTSFKHGLNLQDVVELLTAFRLLG